MHDSNFLYQSEAYTINSFIRLANFPVTLGFGPVKFSISTGSCVTSGRFSLFMALRWFWNWGYVDWHIWCGSKCRLQGQIIKCSRWQILVALLPTALALCVCVSLCRGLTLKDHTYLLFTVPKHLPRDLPDAGEALEASRGVCIKSLACFPCSPSPMNGGQPAETTRPLH